MVGAAVRVRRPAGVWHAGAELLQRKWTLWSQRHAQFSWEYVRTSGGGLDALGDMAAVGELRARVDSALPLADLGAALARLTSRQLTGKVVVKMTD